MRTWCLTGTSSSWRIQGVSFSISGWRFSKVYSWCDALRSSTEAYSSMSASSAVPIPASPPWALRLAPEDSQYYWHAAQVRSQARNPLRRTQCYFFPFLRSNTHQCYHPSNNVSSFRKEIDFPFTFNLCILVNNSPTNFPSTMFLLCGISYSSLAKSSPRVLSWTLFTAGVQKSEDFGRCGRDTEVRL